MTSRLAASALIVALSIGAGCSSRKGLPASSDGGGGAGTAGTMGTGGANPAGAGGGVAGTTGTGGANPAGAGGTAGAGGAGAVGAVCGAPGQLCCPGNSCQGAACCVATLCVAEGASCVPLAGTCRAGSCNDGTCGGPNQPCCDSSTSRTRCTAPATKCMNEVCAPCGNKPGDPCCTISPTSAISTVCLASGLLCTAMTTDATCAACGQPGTRCCSGSTCSGGACCNDGQCIAEGQSCANGGACTGGRCPSCGASAQQCCGTTCGPRLACTNGRCTPCGHPGEACCAGTSPVERCADGGICTTSSSSSSPGVCAICGMPGTPCCADNTCSNGGCCMQNTCIANGATCQTSNAGGSTSYGQCKDGRCPCGDLGQLCCPHHFATGTSCSSFELLCMGTGNELGRCQPCGRKDGPCCEGRACSEAGTGCISDTPYDRGPFACRACGGTGQPCCPSVPSGREGTCRDAGTVCSATTQMCEVCGGDGAPCCANYACTAPGTACNNKLLCEICGRPGTSAASAGPCCPGNLCADGCCVNGDSDGLPFCIRGGTICDIRATGTRSPRCDATAASCATATTTCGGLGQACCLSTVSGQYEYRHCAAPGSRCAANPAGGTTPFICAPCGDNGQRCCIDSAPGTAPSPTGCKAPYLCTSTSSGAYTCVEPVTPAI